MNRGSEMCLPVVCFLLSCFALLASAEPQYHQLPYYPNHYPFFRSGISYPPHVESSNAIRHDDRLLLYTLTLTLTTVTSTTTVLATTTCTTSTAALNTCSAGRRRRELFADADNRRRRGLYYDDSEVGLAETDEGSIFLPLSDHKTAEEDDSPSLDQWEQPKKPRLGRQIMSRPILIQPAFHAESRIRNGRYWLAFGTSTVRATATSTITSVLTAICSSTTVYNTCSSSGK